MSGRPPLEGLQPAMDSQGLISAVRLAVEQARRDEAEIIQSANRALRSRPAQEHADLGEHMTAMVCRVQEVLLDRVRDTFLVAVREAPDVFSAEVIAACRTLLRGHIEESRSRCLNVSRQCCFDVEASAARNEIHFESLMGAMNGIFDILQKIVEPNAASWMCDEPRGGE